MFDLSPWLQVPIVLLVALPAAGLVATVLLRAVDWLGERFARPWRRK
ncbi:hypothetical protein CAPI_03380 [Corynebacterium capitovis DSM 44611]|nr:hypothetical protein [Corynebacterium capitovis]WKD57238.1 hypothetical protein CAPI_03380 [Corynebacterium capitovis DSM 44611]